MLMHPHPHPHPQPTQHHNHYTSHKQHIQTLYHHSIAQIRSFPHNHPIAVLRMAIPHQYLQQSMNQLLQIGLPMFNAISIHI